MKKSFVVVSVFLCMSAVCVYFSRQASRGFVALYQYEHDGEYGKTLHDQNGNVVYEMHCYPTDTGEWGGGQQAQDFMKRGTNTTRTAS